MKGKRCRGCGKYKPFARFTQHKTGYLGYRSRCRACRVKETSEWVKRNGKDWKDPMSMRMQIMVSHMCHSGSSLRTPELKELYRTQKGRCFYTGIPMKIISDRKLDPLLISIDRLDPSKGYVKGNIALCCLGANYLKGTHTKEVLYETIKKFANGIRKKELKHGDYHIHNGV